MQDVQADPELRVNLVGDKVQVEPALAGAGGPHERIDLFHCTQVVTMEESPVEGLRKKPDNSITRCWQLLAQRKVERRHYISRVDLMVHEKQRQEILKDLGADPYVD